MKKILPCVIGLGYVGLSIFLRLQKNFKSIGFDINENRINNLNQKKDQNKEYISEDLKKKNESIFTSKKSLIKNSNFYIITVPTPIFKNNKPNLKFLEDATNLVARNIKKGDIVFYESTVYPGVTKKMTKIIEKISNLKSYKNFWVGYSPERVNPGDKTKTVDKISKIVSFSKCPNNVKNTILKVYKSITPKIVLSNLIEEAETSKVIENIQRDINIAFMNEIMMICDRLNINFHNVKKLASTKWNFLNFAPGLVGGHCLPVDPYYLYDLSKKKKYDSKFILAGRNVNNNVKNFIITKVNNIIKLKKLKKIIIAGISFKKNVSDIRNSLSLSIFKYFKKNKSLKVDAVDPLANNQKLKLKDIKNLKFENYDLVVFLVNHDILSKSLKKFKKKHKEKIFDIFKFLN